MSNERDNESMDELVSKTYRELPAPRAPGHLDESILRMAARSSSADGKFPFAAWVKPVTWAATIALTLTIVLELSELPTSPVPIDAVPAQDSQTESVAEEFAPQRGIALEQAENRARAQAGPDTSSLRKDESAAATEGSLEELVVEDKGTNDSFAASPPAAALPVSRKLAAESAPTFADSAEKTVSDAIASCDTKARQSADDWLECIKNLRESGAIELADREYAAFVLAYPAESANPETNK